MRVCHGVGVVFDDPNLVSAAGLAPIMDLAERAGLHRMTAARLTVRSPAAGVKVTALVATVSTPVAAPVIVATRLRRGACNSARGAARLVADALACAKAAGAGSGPAPGGIVVLRADSAFYSHDVIAAARRGDAHFSITARHDPAVLRAIAAIPDTAWVPIRYPNAIWDEGEQRWVSDAEVAETDYTAFTSRPLAQHVEGG